MEIYPGDLPEKLEPLYTDFNIAQFSQSPRQQVLARSLTQHLASASRRFLKRQNEPSRRLNELFHAQVQLAHAILELDNYEVYSALLPLLEQLALSYETDLSYDELPDISSELFALARFLKTSYEYPRLYDFEGIKNKAFRVSRYFDGTPLNNEQPNGLNEKDWQKFNLEIPEALLEEMKTRPLVEIALDYFDPTFELSTLVDDFSIDSQIRGFRETLQTFLAMDADLLPDERAYLKRKDDLFAVIALYQLKLAAEAVLESADQGDGAKSLPEEDKAAVLQALHSSVDDLHDYIRQDFDHTPLSHRTMVKSLKTLNKIQSEVTTYSSLKYRVGIFIRSKRWAGLTFESQK